VEELRADEGGWATLRRLSEPLYAELDALNSAPAPDVLARRAGRVDLIVGQLNLGTTPYGTAFESVRQRIAAHAGVHELADQGHLAHITAPTALGRLLNSLAAPAWQGAL
jgi:pimeloyl-ACP methyl ester carboxylesterase